MNEIVKDETINIENMIYEIRGVQVMLDSDLAKLYKCVNGTKDINKAVKRNISRFPNDFYFQLTTEEKKNLWFQIGTANKMSRTNPYVFTEQGVAMLASILHTEVAEEASIRIMRSFVRMRKYFVNSKNSNDILINHENRLLQLEKAWDKFKEKELNRIFFKGALYDAYSVLLDIFAEPKEEIIVIDNYLSKALLDILRDINKKVIIISKYSNERLKNKYESQYSNVQFIKCDAFHDRFIIIDRKKFYHCGASFKDLGKRCFGINEMNNSEWLTQLLEIVDESI